MEDSKKVKIYNRKGNGVVFYSIPQMGNLTRTFQPGQEKEVTFEQLRKLSYIPGGQDILKDYLMIQDKQVLAELQYEVEPEYFYKQEDIIKVMLNGSLDEFLDCLDFAPSGVKDSIKDLAVELPLNDVAKRKAILAKLNFDVDRAIANKEIVQQDAGPIVQPIAKRRRAAGAENASANPSKPGRRVTNKN